LTRKIAPGATSARSNRHTITAAAFEPILRKPDE
jgi:hypothetical protein